MPRPVHFELPYADPEKASQFFSSVFGWTTNKWDGPMPYWLALTGDRSTPGIDGGLMLPQCETQPKAPILILDVPDIREYMERVTAHGGKVWTEVMPIPGIGQLAYFSDPEGIAFGLMQFDPKAGNCDGTAAA